jgi:hypothetical protein
MHQRDATRNAVSLASASGVNPTLEALADVYCQPNPGRRDGTSVHYVPGRNVRGVEIVIYDASGAEVRRLGGTTFGDVDNLVHWDGRTNEGDEVPGGLYVVRVTTSGAGASATRISKLAMVR